MLGSSDRESNTSWDSKDKEDEYFFFSMIFILKYCWLLFQHYDNYEIIPLTCIIILMYVDDTTYYYYFIIITITFYIDDIIIMPHYYYYYYY